jgi:hypothetical protein
MATWLRENPCFDVGEELMKALAGLKLLNLFLGGMPRNDPKW